MTKEEFNYLTKSPKNRIRNTDMATIRKLQKKFPYCEIIYNLSLLQAELTNDINFTEILATCAVHSSSRQNLFKLMNSRMKVVKQKTTNQNSYLFEDWLKDSTLTKTKNQQTILVQEGVTNSIQDNDHLTTETLAKIYVEQGHYERAIQAYEILCLKYPKKSGFFANQIKNIKTS